MTRYEVINGQEYEIGVKYNLGGMNYFNGRQDKRGYYLHIQPVKRETYGDGITMFVSNPMDGAKTLIREVNRKSDKQYTLAVKEAEEKVIPWLFDQMGVTYNSRNESEAI